MQFFIDSADTEEIKQAQAMGLLDGVTTNPSLVAKTGRKFKEVLEEIVEIVDGPISAEVVSTDAKGMLKEAREYASIHENIVIKIPMIVEGLKALKVCVEENIKTNITLVFSASQALMVGKIGATYVSPFVGRLDDISTDGMELIQQIRTIYDNYAFETQILVASIRHPIHLVQSALIGADVATIPFQVIQQLAKHPLTDIGLEKFLKDWEKVPS
ncbi:MAG: fructose-6-phosphate aldolase [Deltaproteobacteria bacterium]|nr:fructose-6-phosphate aldolase [Deltaproteobacteria bacterium]